MYSEIWQPDGQTSTDPIVTYIDLQIEEHNEPRVAQTVGQHHATHQKADCGAGGHGERKGEKNAR